MRSTDRARCRWRAVLASLLLPAWLAGCAATPAEDPGGRDGAARSAGAGGEAPGTAIAAPAVGTPADAGGVAKTDGSAENYQFVVDAPKALVAPIREQTFVGRWQRRSDYDPLQFEGLVARLPEEVQAILRSRGYFSGKVEVDPDRAQRIIGLRVRAGPRTTVNRVELELTREGSADQALSGFARAAWTLPEGSFFDSELWQTGKRRLIDALNRRGYLRARVETSEARIDPELTAASLAVKVETGPRIGFGELAIEGLDRYDRRVVDDQRPFKPGDPYDFDEMLLFQSRLRLTGYFEQATVVPDLQALSEDPAAMRVPLKVQLVEKSSKRVAFGLGYSTDEGVRGQIGLEHRDLFGRDWRLESAVVLSQVRARAFANVRTPTDPDGRFVGFGGRLEREDVEGQLSTRSNSYIGLGQRHDGGESFLSMQYQTETVRLAPDAVDPGLRDFRQALVLGLTWSTRRLDSMVDPRDGYALTGQVSVAHEKLASTRGFLRLYGKATRFISFASDSALRDGTLILGAELGIVQASSRQDIPSENLFRAGGSQSVRGYRYQSLGVTERGATVGGRYLAVGTVEYQHRMSDLWSLAAFVDAGNAGDDRGTFEPVYGAGLGVRLRTPVGPIHLDAAYGEAVQRWRLHFSVGTGF
ncbi:MAG: autotransporter assembly complex family protein [Burkholderiaceae bacterium]